MPFEHELKNAYIGSNPWELTDDFSGNSLDVSKWSSSLLANIGTITVNNSLTLYTPGTGGGNAGGPIVETIKKIDGTEKKIVVEVSVTALSGANTSSASIGGYVFNRVSETSSYKCNGNLPILEIWNGTLEVTKSSTSYSGSSNNGKDNYNFTSLSVPYTLRGELDLVNRTAKEYSGDTLLASATIASNVNLNDRIGKPIASMSAIGWNARGITLSNINIKVYY